MYADELRNSPQALPFVAPFSSGAEADSAYSDVNAKFAATLDPRMERYELQGIARHILCRRPKPGDVEPPPWTRLAGCGSWLRQREDGSVYVEVLHSATAGRAYLTGLQTCGSVWVCPVCSGKIADHRKAEVKRALQIHRDRGGGVLFTTFTASHHHMPLARFQDALGAAQRDLYADRGYKQLCEKLGVVGTIRSVELPWSPEHGWHAHFHGLALTSTEDPAAARLLSRFLKRRWPEILRRHGLQASRRRGVVVKDASWDAEEYIAKFERGRDWDVDAELTMGNRKHGGRRGLSPWDLLRIAGGAAGRIEPDRAAGLYREYASATFRRHWMQWSPGLRSLLGLAVAPSDQVIAAGVEELPDMRSLGRIDKVNWRTVVLANDARAELVSAAAAGDVVEVTAFLAELGGTWTPTAEREERYVDSILRLLDTS
jgi:hypothetical protein